MDQVLQEDLKMLMESQDGLHLSLYMPTYQAGAEVQQNTIRCKNLLRESEERLRASGLRPSEVQEWLEPIQQLVTDNDFWQHQSEGLALFRCGDFFRTYRLPQTFDELVVVAERFHLKPLIPLFTGDGHFYVLALSQNAVRLLQCSRHRIHEVPLEDIPQSMEEALRYDDPEKQVQFYTGTPGSGGRGRRAAIFYGQGLNDVVKEDLRRYFRKVDQGLMEILREEHAPLVIASVEYLLPLYREVSNYAYLAQDGVTGNPENVRSEELCEQAWAVVEPLFRLEQDDARAQYKRYAGTGRAANDLETILPAAYDGRIETLFVAVGEQQWGTFDSQNRTVQITSEPTPYHEDLLDFAAVHTLINSGMVYAVPPEQVPGGHSLAAIFRYTM